MSPFLPPDEDYSYQDETEAITSVSYDNDEVIDDFNYKNRAVVYSDVLDQKSYIPYVHETYFYPNQDPASFSALTTSPVTPVNKKDLPCFKFANQNCDLSDNCPYSLKRKRSQSTLTPIIPESPDPRNVSVLQQASCIPSYPNLFQHAPSSNSNRTRPSSHHVCYVE